MSARVTDMKALFILDTHTYDAMENGGSPIVPYSHDRNLLLLAHEARRKGIDIYMCRGVDTVKTGDFRPVEAVFPAWRFGADLRGKELQFDFVICAGIEQLNVRKYQKDAKIIGVLPALHMIESPGLHAPMAVFNLITALRYNVDFLLTQNERMRDVFTMISVWLARWDPSDRFYTAPLGFCREQLSPALLDRKQHEADREKIRKSVSLSVDDILIVNSGGAWGWTDCDTLVEAFCRYAQTVPTKIRLYFPGLRQPDNTDVNEVAERIERLSSRFPKAFGSHFGEGALVCIEPNWAKGGKDIKTLLHAADIGMSVNKTSLETWQSHRVRFIDYISHCLPVLGTSGDMLSSRFKDVCFFVESGNVDSYIRRFEEIEAARPKLSNMRETVVAHWPFLDSQIVYGKFWDRVMSTPRRSEQDIRSLEACFLDTINDAADESMRDRFEGVLADLLNRV